MPQQLFNTSRVSVVTVPGDQNLKFGFSYPTDKDWADRARLHPSFSAVKGDEIRTVDTDTAAFDRAVLLRCLGPKPVEPKDDSVFVPMEHPPAPGVYEFSNGKFTPSQQWPDIDGEFAKRVMSRFDTANILDDECSANGQITVVMRVGVGTAEDGSRGHILTKHVFRQPTAAAIDAYFSQSRDSATRIKKKEIRQTTLLEPGGELYDRCIISTDGYEGSVPLNHKAAAASKLAEMADRTFEPEFDEDPKG